MHVLGALLRCRGGARPFGNPLKPVKDPPHCRSEPKNRQARLGGPRHPPPTEFGSPVVRTTAGDSSPAQHRPRTCVLSAKSCVDQESHLQYSSSSRDRVRG